MKICHVAPGFIRVPSGGSGAVENIIHELCSTLCKLGHDVTLLDSFFGPRVSAPYRLSQVAVWWHLDSNLMTHAVRGFVYQRLARRRLRELLQQNDHEVVHFYNQFSAVGGIPVAQRYGALAVFHSHNPTWGNASACQSATERLKFTLERIAFRKADVVISCGRSVANNLVNYLNVPSSKVVGVPNGLEDSWFTVPHVPSSLKERYAPNRERIVLNVARVSPYKNQMTLVKAVPRVVAAVPKIRFLLVGPESEPTYGVRLRDMIREMHLEGTVLLLGELPRADVQMLYHLCDLVVLCSSTEAQPLALLEAMASGKPVCVSAIGPLEEVLPEDVRLTVPPFDEEALADTIIQLLKNDALRQNTGNRLREHVYDNHRWTNVAQRLVEVYSEFRAK